MPLSLCYQTKSHSFVCLVQQAFSAAPLQILAKHFEEFSTTVFNMKVVLNRCGVNKGNGAIWKSYLKRQSRFFFKWQKSLPEFWRQRHEICLGIVENSERVGMTTVVFCSMIYLFYAWRDTQESINGQRPAERTGRREMPALNRLWFQLHQYYMYPPLVSFKPCTLWNVMFSSFYLIEAPKKWLGRLLSQRQISIYSSLSKSKAFHSIFRKAYCRFLHLLHAFSTKTRLTINTG